VFWRKKDGLVVVAVVAAVVAVMIVEEGGVGVMLPVRRGLID
jgi:hypothetical protein